MLAFDTGIKLDENGAMLHPWMFVQKGEHLFIPERDRSGMSPDLSGGMIATRNITVISLDLIAIKLNMDDTLGNANMIAYKFDGMEYLALGTWMPSPDTKAH